MSHQERGRGRGGGNVHQRGRRAGVPSHTSNYAHLPPDPSHTSNYAHLPPDPQPPHSYSPSHPIPNFPTTPLPSQNPPYPNISIVVHQQPPPVHFDHSPLANHGPPLAYHGSPLANHGPPLANQGPPFNLPPAQTYDNPSWQTGQEAYFKNESNQSHYRQNHGRDPPPHHGYFKEDRNNYTSPHFSQNSQHPSHSHQRNLHHDTSQENTNRQDYPHRYTSQENIHRQDYPHRYTRQENIHRQDYPHRYTRQENTNRQDHRYSSQENTNRQDHRYTSQENTNRQDYPHRYTSQENTNRQDHRYTSQENTNRQDHRYTSQENTNRQDHRYTSQENFGHQNKPPFYTRKESTDHNERRENSTRSRSNMDTPTERLTPPPPYDQLPSNLGSKYQERTVHQKRSDSKTENRQRRQQNKDDRPHQVASFSFDDKGQNDCIRENSQNLLSEKTPVPYLYKNIPGTPEGSSKVSKDASREKYYKKNKGKDKVNKSSSHRSKLLNISGNMGEMITGAQAKHDFVKVPLERRSSNVSLPESEKSTSSETSSSRNNFGRQKKWKAGDQRNKFFKQNKEGKFKSMPDLEKLNEGYEDKLTGNSVTSTGHPVNVQAAAEKTQRKFPKKKRDTFLQKKTVDMTHQQQDNLELTQESQETFLTSRSTKADLKMWKSFDNADSLKEFLRQNIDISQNKTFSLEFVTDSIVCQEGLSCCTVIFNTSSKQQGKRQIKNLCLKLHKKLKIQVKYNICGVDEDRNVKEQDLTGKEKQVEGIQSVSKEKQVMVKSPDKSLAQNSIRKTVDAMLEHAHFKDTEKKIVDGKVVGINNKPQEIPTKISVTIDKFFLTEVDLKKYFTEICHISFELVPGSFNSTTSQTKCLLLAHSKAASQKIEKKLTSYKVGDTNIKCLKLNDGRLVQNLDQSSNAEDIQVRIKETIDEITKKTEKTLEAHLLKLASYEKALQVFESSCVSDDDDDGNVVEKLAVFDKLKEVAKQRDTFCSRRDELIEKAKKVNNVTTSRKELSDLLQSVGVECERLKAALPIYARREDITRKVFENQVSIILGETGSGKSTQMTQYIHEAGLAGQGMIVCTQPRKVAAITLAERVAKEMAVKVGRLVGYKTGLKKHVSTETKIVFATDHCLLNECLADRSLSSYSCIIVDEAHERSIYTDLLLGMVKACLLNRPDLKVVITSATIDPEIFIRYFNCSPELRVSGRTFPVDIVYSDIDESVEFEEFEIKAVKTAVNVHRNEGPGDILVFLTSAVDIMRCIGEFEKLMSGKDDFKCFPLHGQLTPDEQRRVFERLDQGIRKIVFATNCAETSITIDGIKYVIDTGVAKEIRYDSKRNICMLGTYVVSKSSANQRKGRAGRTSSGKCYRLYTEEGYNTMKDSSEPEILKVPLGQSVLKLAELEVDVKTYDFVQPPSAEAIDSALNTLRGLGALSSGGITDLGRWIAKLPFSPKEGFLIYHGSKKNLLYDSVVLASLITNGSNMFYRGLTESEAQASARSKSQFGSPYGDIFTWLEVYKAWLRIDVKQQSKWCQEQSINYKVMSFTKKCVKEVATILKNEFKIKLEYNFTENESVMLSLRKIIFEAHLSSVCCYLGHIRAGYHALLADRQVHIHPSSNLLSHNTQPEWVVYSEFTKTSRDFIKGITVVEEDWVLEAVGEGKLLVDLNLSKQQKIKLVHSESVGLSVFRKLVGVKYSQLRVWEDDLTHAGMNAVVVEADNEFGTFHIFSSSDMNQDIATSIATVKSEVIEFLKSDEVEIDILKKSGTEPCGVRVMLGHGGCIKSLLMPDESNKILITKTSEQATDEVIRTKFGVFGEIREYVRFKRLDPWGFIRYSSFAEAKTAVQQTCNHLENVAVLKIDTQLKKMVSRFEAKLSWCRRPIKGKGTAFIKCPPIERAGLVSKVIMLPVGARELSLSNKGEDLVCFNSGTSQEADIKMAVMEILQYDKDLTQNIHVSVVREQGAENSQGDLNRMKVRLSEHFSQYVARDKFSLHLMSAKRTAVNQIAFIHFESPTDGFTACSQLQGHLFEQDQLVSISPTLKTTLHVPAAIMNVCKDRFNEIVRDLEKYKETEVQIRSMKLGDYAFDIKSRKVKSMIEARELLQKELEGEIIDCKVDNLLKKLLKQQGKEVLRKIESSMDILIVFNERRELVHIYGSNKNISQALIKINSYLNKIAEGKQADVFLRGEGKPAGLMKELMRKYTNLQDDLIQVFSLSDVIIDFKQQKLSIFGSSENVDKALVSISELESSLFLTGIKLLKKGIPDCVVCLCPIESCSEMYRLEACGHCYCHQCLRMQINVSEQDKIFPVICAKSDCSMPLVWRDFQFCLKNSWTTKDKLVERSVNACVATNPDKYRFCITPDCPVVYEVTKNEDGVEFSCPSCFISLCTSCHTAFHAGLTCSMSSIDERMLRSWVMENPHNRKLCPGCHVGVEKSEGCNKMLCSSCHTFFCWVCLTICENEQKCYAHLVKIHGGFN